MSARALLATRRLRPFLPFAIGLSVLIYAGLYVIRGPIADRAVAAQRAAGRANANDRDTLSLAANAIATRREYVRQDSAFHALLFQAEALAAAPALAAETLRDRDSLRAELTQLTAALDRAAKAPLPASYRLLSNTRALRPLRAVQMLVDTLDLVEQARQALDPTEAPIREFAQLSQRANAIGATLQGIGRARQRGLSRQIASIETSIGGSSGSASPSVDTGSTRAARDSARHAVANAESLLRDARQWHAHAQAGADSVARTKAARILGASPFVAATSALLIAGVLGFLLAVVAEARVPTIAHAREVERLTGLPVLATAHAFQVPHEGRARLQPGIGVDPFRMVYLALTASGTHARAVCVTGDDVPFTVAVAGRLAVSAAADERATLLVDLAPGIPSASAYFGWREEPGFTEAIAGVRLWREVSRPIGASDGLAIDVIPAGGPRSDTAASVQNHITRSEFMTFVAEYDFAVLVAPTLAAARMAAAVCGTPPTIVVARTARTRLQSLQESLASLKTADVVIHGILLIDKK